MGDNPNDEPLATLVTDENVTSVEAAQRLLRVAVAPPKRAKRKAEWCRLSVRKQAESAARVQALGG